MNTRFAEVLKLYRFVHKVSLEDMAKSIGVSRATLNRIENGHGIDSATCVDLLFN